MKAVILAGGSVRGSEETVARPKPMVEIGGKPILWHILNIFASYGVNEFVIAFGYRAEVVKEHFLNSTRSTTASRSIWRAGARLSIRATRHAGE
jgi:NDP-sugar pyrophosphorylase family protein